MASPPISLVHLALKVRRFAFLSSRAWPKVAALSSVAVLMFGTSLVNCQGQATSASLVLQVQAEALLRAGNGNIALKIRLDRGATANLWAGDACGVPPAESRLITISGSYIMPLATLQRPTVANSSSHLVCLLSSDGILRESLPVDSLISPGGGAGLAAPATFPSVGSMGATTRGVTTVESGVTTLSNP